LPLPRWVLPVVLLLAAIVLAPALRAPFEFDDATAIPANASIHTLWPPSEALSPPLNTAVSGRPVVNYTFAINTALNRRLGVDERPNPLGPNKTLGFHVLNMALHLFCGLLLFGVIRRTARSANVPERWRDRADWLAAGATALWLLHPIQTEAVHYIVQRTELMVSLCYIGTLYAWIRAWDAPTTAATRRWRVATVAICLLGMGSKEVMISAPLMMALYDRAFRVSSWKTLVSDRERVAWYGALLATTAWTIANVTTNARHNTVGFSLGMPWYSYAYTQAWAVAHYLRLLALPDRLTFDYGQRPISGGTGVPGALLIGGLAVGTIAAWRRVNSLGWLAFLGVWFFLLLAPSSSVVPITTEIAAERRVYLASASVIVAALVAIVELGRRFSLRKQSRVPPKTSAAAATGLAIIGMSLWSAHLLSVDDTRAMVIAALFGVAGMAVMYAALAGRERIAFGAVALLFAAGTFLRSRVYASADALWRSATAEVPGNPRALTNLAATMFYVTPPKLTEAEALYRNSIALDSTYVQAWTGLASTVVDLGRPDEAVWLLERAIKIDPEYLDAIGQLGSLLMRRGDTERAAPYLEQFAAATSNDNAYFALGGAYLRNNQIGQAIAALRHAVEINPDRPEALRMLGGVLVELEKGSDAAPLLERLVKSGQPSAIDLGLLAVAYGEMGRTSDATNQATAAARAGHDNAPALLLAGRAMLLAGRAENAEQLFEKALSLKPGDREAEARLEMARAAVEAARRRS
jgi:tetratricopeptide (TPR) repeat protein